MTGAGLTAGNTGGVITAVAFHGDGSALTGISAGSCIGRLPRKLICRK